MTIRIAALAAALLLTGCGSLMNRQADDPRPMGSAWSGEIATAAAHGHSGYATAAVLQDGRTRVNVTLAGGSAGGVHPWRIHTGGCREQGQVVGSETAYPTLTPDDSGAASATATLPLALDPADEYSVKIHGPGDPDGVVGCGELEPLG